MERRGKVFSFEPLDENFNYLKKHIEINKYKIFFLLKLLFLKKSGFSFLNKEQSRAEAHLDKEGVKVETISLDDRTKRNKLPPPNFIKIDVEGAGF